MSRSGYDEDGGEYLELNRGAVEQAIRGKRGQKLLTELAAAMDAMPVKGLIANDLQVEGAYCALGVVGAARGVEMSKINPEDARQISKTFDIAESLAREIAWVNDDDFGYERNETPKKRWQRVRTWVTQQIKTGTDEATT